MQFFGQNHVTDNIFNPLNINYFKRSLCVLHRDIYTIYIFMVFFFFFNTKSTNALTLERKLFSTRPPRSFMSCVQNSIRNSLSNYLTHTSYVKMFYFHHYSTIHLPPHYYYHACTTNFIEELTAIFNFSYIVSQIKYGQQIFNNTRAPAIKVQA